MNDNKNLWIVLGLIAAALVLFFLFGRDPVEETGEAMNQAATSTSQAVDRTALRADAAADLTALRVRQEAGESYESLQDNYAEVRARLAASYQNVEGEAKEEWDQTLTAFDEFEANARAGTSNSLDLLTRLIASLSADVRTETAAEEQ